MHLLADTALTIAVGLAMLRMGVRKNRLSVRPSSRRCASCGRHIETPFCRHCTR